MATCWCVGGPSASHLGALYLRLAPRIAVAVGMSRSSKGVKGVEDIEKAGWDVGKVLGEGAFGKVVFVTRKSDGVSAACKIITKPKEVKKMKLVEMEYKARDAPARRARTACAA